MRFSYFFVFLDFDLSGFLVEAGLLGPTGVLFLGEVVFEAREVALAT